MQTVIVVNLALTLLKLSQYSHEKLLHFYVIFQYLLILKSKNSKIIDDQILQITARRKKQ